MWLPLLLCCPFVTWYLINPPVSLSPNKKISPSRCSPGVFSPHRAISVITWLWKNVVQVAWIPLLFHEPWAQFRLETSASNTMGVEINFSITSAAAAIIRSSEVQKERGGKGDLFTRKTATSTITPPIIGCGRGSLSVEIDSYINQKQYRRTYIKVWHMVCS